MRTATASQMRQIDAEAIEHRGIPSLVLMERAAQAVADKASSLLRSEGLEHPARVAVLCGAGNNGGDGFAAARILRRAGIEATAFLVGDPDRMTPDCKEMARRLTEAGGSVISFDPTDTRLKACDLYLDAIIGFGLHAPLHGKAALAADFLAQTAEGRILAVDIPSGIDADTGRDLGCGFCCRATVTFTLPKPGHFIGAGSVACGSLTVADIGIPTDLVECFPSQLEALTEKNVRTILPKRDPAGHKGSFGKVLLFGGSIGYTGAPILAAEAALHSGTGLVYLGVPESVYPIAAVKCRESMPFPLPSLEDGTLSSEAASHALALAQDKDALLIGPGLGQSDGAMALLETVMTRSDAPLVIDADGLNLLAQNLSLLQARQSKVTILTPHDGEFSRLGGDLSSDDRLGAARDFARHHGVILILKGRGTLVAQPNGSAFVNTTGNSGMAKGGSGDALSGILLALLGQHLPPEKAAAAAVWLHGHAGDLAAAEKGEYGMLPRDLIAALPQAFRSVSETASPKLFE
ncbi:MAG: NAD(P)H-hydrate dehydratase [Clostridia bacterium]|nr:NAD(P)H-hydrate dehydratase [Clostridia bacterium]